MISRSFFFPAFFNNWSGALLNQAVLAAYVERTDSVIQSFPMVERAKAARTIDARLGCIVRDFAVAMPTIINAHHAK